LTNALKMTTIINHWCWR